MTVLLIAAALFAQGDPATISGVVVDGRNRPVASAEVFLERGLGARIVSTRSAVDGTFRFDSVSPVDSAGVFAVSPSYAVGGVSTRVAIGDRISGLTVRLLSPARVQGSIVDDEGRPVGGARVLGYAIRDQKVGIPLSKLSAYGISEPVSGADGSFTIEGVPAGSTIDLKIVHPEFAQSGVQGVRAGSSGVDVQMTRGVFVRGHVAQSGTSKTVPGAPVLILRASPPHDTIVTQTRGDGSFNVRLTPGTYYCEVRGGAYRSGARKRLDVTGQVLTQSVALYVAGTGILSGTVQDAESGAPVAGARIRHDADGFANSVAITGPGGEFRFEVAGGNNVLQLESAPGFYDPQPRALNFTVPAGGAIEHTFWVVKAPKGSLLIVDASDRPVADAAVRLLRPMQYGWHFSGPDGTVALEVGSLPGDGLVVGIAEHPSWPLGALFAIDGRDDERTTVELGPYGSVSGRVTNGAAALTGAVVSARFVDDSIPDGLVLWQTVSRGGGAFGWPGVAPQVPHALVAQSVSGSGAAVSSGAVSFIVDGLSARDVGRLDLAGGDSSESLVGKAIDLSDFPALCSGAASGVEGSAKTCVMFVSVAEAGYAIEALTQLQLRLSEPGGRFVVVADGPVACEGSSISVLRGSSPGVARTLILDREGRVTLETFGLPPLFALMEGAAQ